MIYCNRLQYTQRRRFGCAPSKRVLICEISTSKITFVNVLLSVNLDPIVLKGYLSRVQSYEEKTKRQRNRTIIFVAKQKCRSCEKPNSYIYMKKLKEGWHADTMPINTGCAAFQRVSQGDTRVTQKRRCPCALRSLAFWSLLVALTRSIRCLNA